MSRLVGIIAGAALLFAAAACSSASGSGTTPSTPIATPSATIGASPSGVLPTGSAPPSVIPSGTMQTYSSHGVTFQYPADWQGMTPSGTATVFGNQAWSTTVGTDRTNFVTVASYRINASVTQGNIQQQMQGIASQLTGLFQQAGGSLKSGPTVETVAGLPALSFVGTATPNGTQVTNHVVLIFHQSTEYLVDCQYTSSNSSQMEQGCSTILDSFQVTG
ncbi:MAG TPA: PsbP-related protein [Actinomycetota bacterium]|jgi:hypothetical protein|nr:PsbP-related protein [Actinomycetota bacterium]